MLLFWMRFLDKLIKNKKIKKGVEVIYMKLRMYKTNQNKVTDQKFEIFGFQAELQNAPKTFYNLQNIFTDSFYFS